jgi:hypothetical protein
MGINLTFRRNFGNEEAQEWEDLQMLLGGVVLSQEPDSVKWCLEKSGEFLTSSLYNAITFPGVNNKWMSNIWAAHLPLKICSCGKYVMTRWQSAEQLAKKNWQGPTECKLCGRLEGAEHIFVQCVLANFCWSVFRDVLEWGILPTCMEDIPEKVIGGSNRNNKNFVFPLGCLSWSLWLIRNDFIFNNVLVSSPNFSLYRTISLMQKWKVLHKEKGRCWIDSVTIKLKHRQSSLESES